VEGGLAGQREGVEESSWLCPSRLGVEGRACCKCRGAGGLSLVPGLEKGTGIIGMSSDAQRRSR